MVHIVDIRVCSIAYQLKCVVIDNQKMNHNHHQYNQPQQDEHTPFVLCLFLDYRTHLYIHDMYHIMGSVFRL
jgi:hypothetical protein